MKKIICLLCLLPLFVQAQEWKIYRSAVEKVPEDGYYHIGLPQELIGVSANTSLDDIRVYNSSGEEVPYFVRSEKAMQEVQQLLYYELLENTAKDSLNRIVLRNSQQRSIHRFLIVVRPAEVTKTVQIRGSHDRKQWFIVKQFQEINRKSHFNQTNEIIPVDFPDGNYPYYEITLRNNGQSPLDIAGVVRAENQQIYNTLSALPTIRFTQKDSTDRYTYIHFHDLRQNFRFDRVDFFITYPTDYYRKAEYRPGNRFSFELTSGQANSIYPETTRLTPESYFRINNQNSPPLQIDSIHFYGLNRYLCAFLTADEIYTIVIDERQNGRVQYDIQHFQNEIPSDIPIVKASLPVVTVKQTPEDTRPTWWLERPAVLWAIIIGTALFLLFICLKVMKETK